VAVVARPGVPRLLEFSVALDGEPLRLGIAWRSDDAEPGALVLTHVIPGSPAARAGLRIGDRIYQYDGRDCGDERDFLKSVRNRPGPIRLLRERDGRLETIEVHPQSRFQQRRAA
jgi:C-terminal processing protease CtpA/Prc